MKIQKLEHILRAAGSISGCRDMVVLGSQAILASFPDAPASLRVSVEADVYPLDDPEKADPMAVSENFPRSTARLDITPTGWDQIRQSCRRTGGYGL